MLKREAVELLEDIYEALEDEEELPVDLLELKARLALELGYEVDEDDDEEVEEPLINTPEPDPDED